MTPELFREILVCEPFRARRRGQSAYAGRPGRPAETSEYGRPPAED